MDPLREAFFREQAQRSIILQAEMEAQPQMPFDEFLREYFAQH